MQRYQRVVLPLFLWLSLATVAPLIADEESPVRAPVPKAGILDIVPADAGAAFAIRDLKDLKAKGDKFIDETKMKVFIRPSQLFGIGLQWIGIKQGIDDEAAMALILVDLKKVGVENVDISQIEKTLVLAIPFSDKEQMAANFSLKAADLPPEKIVKTGKKEQFLDLRGYVAVRGAHLLMSSHDKAIEAVLKSKPLRSEVGWREQQFLDKSDMMLHVGPRGWGKDWENVVQEVEKGIDAKEDSPEAQLVRQLGEAIRQLRFGIVGARLDGGLSLNIITLFDDDGPAAKLLTEMAGGPGNSELTGLPDGNVLAAHAARGDGEKNVVLAQALVELLLKNLANTDQFVAAAERPQFVGVFSEVWQRLKGSRFAVYENADETRLGLLNMVAILDTEDPQDFLTEMRELASFISSAGLELSDGKTEGIDKKRVEELIRDLGDDSFRVRRSATVKLSLIGEPVIPLLEEATKSDDLEVANRSKRLRQQLMAAAAERRKDLLGQDLLSRVRPKFAYFEKAETRAESPIDIINVRLSEEQEGYNRQLQQLLGPEWAKIRVATHGKQVLVLFGSDTKLLAQALKLAKNGEPGLGKHVLLTEFRSRSDVARKVEIHMSLARAKQLVTPPADGTAPEKPDKNHLSSISLTIAPNRIQVDLFAPFPEARVYLKDQGW